MNTSLKSMVAAGVLAAGMAAGSAQAAVITGSISFTDGGLTVPPVVSTSIVSQLTSITQGPGSANGCTGAFTGGATCGGIGFTATTISIPGNSGSYSWNGYTFTISSVTDVVRTALHGGSGTGVLLSDALQFDIAGLVSGNGITPTAFQGIWTGNGSCIGNNPPASCTSDVTASWSVSISALGRTVPEPATLSLLGIALVGLGAMGRRKQA